MVRYGPAGAPLRSCQTRPIHRRAHHKFDGIRRQGQVQRGYLPPARGQGQVSSFSHDHSSKPAVGQEHFRAFIVTWCHAPQPLERTKQFLTVWWILAWSASCGTCTLRPVGDGLHGVIRFFLQPCRDTNPRRCRSQRACVQRFARCQAGPTYQRRRCVARRSETAAMGVRSVAPQPGTELNEYASSGNALAIDACSAVKRSQLCHPCSAQPRRTFMSPLCSRSREIRPNGAINAPCVWWIFHHTRPLHRR